MTKVTQVAAFGLLLAVTAGTLPAQNETPKSGAAAPMPKAPVAVEKIAPPQAPARPTGTAATVNGQALPEVAVARALMGVESKNRQKARPEIINFLVENLLVDQYLGLQKVTAEPKDVDAQLAEFKAEVAKHKQDYATVLANLMLTEEEIKEQIAAQLRWDKFVNAQAPDDKLKAFFEQNVEMFDGSLCRARHILLSPGEANAKQLRDLKAKIETDVAAALAKLPADADNLTREKTRCQLTEQAFMAAAKERSNCPSKEDGGDINWFPRAGTMVEPFAKAAFALKPYQISDVVATEFGVHLILVTSRKAGQATKFEAVKEAVKEVYGGKLRDAVTAQMRARSKIEITGAKQ